MKLKLPVFLAVLTLGYAALQIIGMFYTVLTVGIDDPSGKEFLSKAFSLQFVLRLIADLSLLVGIGTLILGRNKLVIAVSGTLLVYQVIDQIYWFDIAYLTGSVVAFTATIIFYGCLTYGCVYLKTVGYYKIVLDN